ncbi:MAG: hypothetical protein QME60_08090 [Verrucomicrobiota bacterium]|nr:hypothetical protein [Verrucomicrobiota bacterium]
MLSRPASMSRVTTAGLASVRVEVDRAARRLAADFADRLRDERSAQERFAFAALAETDHGLRRRIQVRDREFDDLVHGRDKADAVLGRPYEGGGRLFGDATLAWQAALQPPDTATGASQRRRKMLAAFGQP